MSIIEFSWSNKSSQAKLINHNHEKEVQDIYLSRSILDYFKSTDWLVQTRENYYVIEHHYFLLSLNPESWEISQDPPITSSSNTLASVVHSITGTLLVEQGEDKVKQITCQLNQ